MAMPVTRFVKVCPLDGTYKVCCSGLWAVSMGYFAMVMCAPQWFEGQGVGKPGVEQEALPLCGSVQGDDVA